MISAFFPAVFGILALLFWVAFISSVGVFFPAIYLLAKSPNRILSSLFSFKVWGGGILAILLAVGLFANDLLEQIGFGGDAGGLWTMSNLRLEIILLLVGGYLLVIGKKFLPRSLFDTEKNEVKSPVLYTSHVFHLLSTGILILLDVFLLVYLTNWLLKFGFADQFETHESGLKFLMNFISIVVPTALLGVFLLPSYYGQKRIMPKIQSEACAIFHFVLLFVSGFVMLFTLAITLRECLMSLLAFGSEISIGGLRIFLILLALSATIFFWTWKNIGGQKSFVKK